MVAPTKINEERLRIMLSSGISKSKIAAKLGVTPGAITRRIKSLGIQSTALVVGSKKSSQALVTSGLKATEQLTRINTTANSLLDEAMTAIESQAEATKPMLFGTPDQMKEPLPVDLGAARQVALKAMAEIRSQLQLHLEISKTLYSIEEADAFRRTILEVLEDVDINVRNEVVKRLRSKRAIKSAIEGI